MALAAGYFPTFHALTSLRFDPRVVALPLGVALAVLGGWVGGGQGTIAALVSVTIAMAAMQSTVRSARDRRRRELADSPDAARAAQRYGELT